MGIPEPHVSTERGRAFFHVNTEEKINDDH